MSVTWSQLRSMGTRQRHSYTHVNLRRISTSGKIHCASVVYLVGLGRSQTHAAGVPKAAASPGPPRSRRTMAEQAGMRQRAERRSCSRDTTGLTFRNTRGHVASRKGTPHVLSALAVCTHCVRLLCALQIPRYSWNRRARGPSMESLEKCPRCTKVHNSGGRSAGGACTVSTP